MPRFIVTFFDPADSTVHQCTVRSDTADLALIEHPWIKEVYLPKWILANLVYTSPEKPIAEAIHEMLGYITCVANLDEEIMKDLNGSDSSASSFPA